PVIGAALRMEERFDEEGDAEPKAVIRIVRVTAQQLRALVEPIDHRIAVDIEARSSIGDSAVRVVVDAKRMEQVRAFLRFKRFERLDRVAVEGMQRLRRN